jgi:outer membrane protein
MSVHRYFLVALAVLPLSLSEAPLGVAYAQTAPAPAATSAPAAAPTGAQASAPLTTSQQAPPDVNVPPSKAVPYEPSGPVKSLGRALMSQWQPTSVEVPAENFISHRYITSMDNTVRRLTLKQAIYTALANNPNVRVAELTPVGAIEGVATQNAIFDPDLTSTLDTIKTVIPATTSLETKSGDALSTKEYDWNFAVNKILAQTNGTMSLNFTNNRTQSNNTTESVNPYYTPTLAMSLSQPLLRNFGWKFATINVRLAESAQRQAQWSYAQTLNDFVQRVAADYWGVVQGEENLRVAQEALKFNSDLVRVNRISVQVGTLAPIDLQEAQSAEATAQANVYTAEAALQTARAVLRQDVMLNPRETFVPQNIEPAERPNPSQHPSLNQAVALEEAVEYRPSLAAMREAIRTALLQNRFQENQILPQVNAQMQFATTSTAGNALCGSTFGVVQGNCSNPSLAPVPGQKYNGYQLPFGGSYGTGLNRLFNFSFYNYAIVFTFERPLANGSANAALAQSRIAYEQNRTQYRAGLSQVVVEVQSALANLNADIQRVAATRSATYYARQSLHDEQVRFRVGMATTHDLLQFQSELVSAEGNQVQAEIDLENAKVALEHATGTLLHSFQIAFELQQPGETPWYAHM